MAADGAQAPQGDEKDDDAEGDAEGDAPGEAAADGRADDAGAPKGDAKGDGKKKRKKKKRGEGPARERPAFNVSDVVFGKIVEVNDDAIFIDLSGKANAIFDKLELVLPEDSIDVEDEARHAEELAESIVAGTIDPDVVLAPAAALEAAPVDAAAEAAPAPAAADEGARGKIIRIVRASSESAQPAAPAPANGEGAAEGSTDASAAAPADATPDAVVDGAAASEVEAPAAAAPDESGADAPREQAASTEADGDAKSGSVLQLPRVVLEPGAPFVGVVRNDGVRGGHVVLTHHPHRASKSKPFVAAAFKKRSEILGLVTGVIKGGVEVDLDGVRGFAPGSQMDLRFGADLRKLVGKRLPFHVSHYAKRGRDVIVSRRAMLESEAKALREAALSRIAAGQVATGVVRRVVQFGAFIDIGGVEGLVPLMEMSHNRGDRPSDVFKAGESIEVLVQKIDDRGKIWLSRKAVLPDPWGEAAKKYALGTKHSGKVARIQPFGVFVELESGIDGLIHLADLSLKRIDKPEDVVKVGDDIEVVVASLDSGHHKIGLHPALTGAMADEVPQKVEVGKTLKVQVVAIDPGGLIIRVLGATGRSARGFIPASATGTPRGTELRKHFPPGHILEAKVLERDPRRGEVKLSVRAMQQETERNAYQAYRQQVKREAKFGTFADLLAKKTPPK